MELLKDFDCMIFHHLREASVVANALSRRSISNLARIAEVKRLLITEIHELIISGMVFQVKGLNLLLIYVKLFISLMECIKAL